MKDKTPKSAHLKIRAVGSLPPTPGERRGVLPLSGSERTELARLAEIVEYRTPGSQILLEGESSRFLFLLATGVVRTHVTLTNGDRQILAFHWPGDLFGLAAEGRYVASAEAVTPSTVYRFPYRELQDLLEANPGIQYGFFVKALHEWRAAQRQLIVMGRFDVSKRLAIFLLDCSTHDAFFEAKDGVLTLPMTRCDIADYLGTSAESITRAVAKLEREGLLARLSAREFRLDREKLQAFASFT
ncbi:Crp/Fnr family transcriptional regulator [Aurantimonas sp. VKM B-3413]|uniref:Crp/Fnr family transcriptional regulator n=1 Tax=Aurantimonas sp. VKM B-3413 TaxID=2779401 RepID=UPI001E4A697F|nr:Crp/Fnr family transcriptional regulator [Aurantimonas sp. VKM B-3413]